MKSWFKPLVLNILLLLMLTVSCKRITITTVLKGNASMQRIISVSGDSSGIGETAYPIPQDGTWEMTQEKKDSTDSEITFVISKNFTDVQELNEELSYRDDTVKVNALAKLDKKFRWFYTYYRYEETFYAFSPFKRLAMSDVMTPEEIEFYFAGIDTLDVEDKAEEYHSRSIFEEFYVTLMQAVTTSSQFREYASQLEQNKEELYNLVTEDWDFEADDYSIYFLKIVDSLIEPSPSFTTLRSFFDAVEDKMWEYLTFFEQIIGEDYRVVVKTPGLVTDTNANNTIQECKVAWEFEPDHFHYRDYVMWVESRKLNVVPIVITAFFLATGLFMVWLSARRSYRQKLESQGIAWEDRKRFVLKWWMSTIVLLIGLGLTGYFSYIIILFNSEPVFFFLDIFDASPAENTIFISLTGLGVILVVWAGYQLFLYFRMKKRG